MVQLSSPRPHADAPRAGALARFCAEHFGPRPAVTLYRAQGRRVEISGAVLANWAHKTANFAEEELIPGAAEPKALISCRQGWRRIALCAGLWEAGVETDDSLLEQNPDDAAQLLFLDDPASAHSLLPRLGPASVTVLVPHADMAARWDGGSAPDLPGEVLDYAQLVPGYADGFFGSGPGLTAELTSRKLAASSIRPDPGQPVALRAEQDLPLSEAPALLAAGHPLVLIEEGADAEQAVGENSALPM